MEGKEGWNWMKPRKTQREHKKDKENGRRQAKRVMAKQPKKKTDKSDIRKEALKNQRKV